MICILLTLVKILYFIMLLGIVLAEVAKPAGDDSHWSSSAAFFDVENDGDLDFAVVNYLDAGLKNNRICGQAVSSKSNSDQKMLFIPEKKGLIVVHGVIMEPRIFLYK